ncbi:MAG: hypothetical protein ACRDRJ_03090 [Streptosporangiaceae bacterium]
MQQMQKTRQRSRRPDDETIELPVEPAADTSAAADVVAAINEVLGDSDVR